jgi:hypothetical protein
MQFYPLILALSLKIWRFTMDDMPEKSVADEASTYFSVAPIKFVIMSFGTFGIYDLYWFYKNWCHIKQKNNLNIMPFWRAFFAPLWSYSAFTHIQNEINKKELSIKLNTVLFAILYFIIQATWKLPEPYMLISVFSFLLIVPANNATTLINKKIDSGFIQNSKIESWNWLAVVVGLPLMVLGVIGTFLPVQA